jgi:hypothetical protein
VQTGWARAARKAGSCGAQGWARAARKGGPPRGAHPPPAELDTTMRGSEQPCGGTCGWGGCVDARPDNASAAASEWRCECWPG